MQTRATATGLSESLNSELLPLSIPLSLVTVLGAQEEGGGEVGRDPGGANRPLLKDRNPWEQPRAPQTLVVVFVFHKQIQETQRQVFQRRDADQSGAVQGRAESGPQAHPLTVCLFQAPGGSMPSAWAATLLLLMLQGGK